MAISDYIWLNIRDLKAEISDLEAFPGSEPFFGVFVGSHCTKYSLERAKRQTGNRRP
jgi:hypothetical protein